MGFLEGGALSGRPEPPGGRWELLVLGDGEFWVEASWSDVFCDVYSSV